MPNVVVYLTRHCPYCVHAKRLLDRKGVAYTVIDVGKDPSLRKEMVAKSGRTTVPQIFIDDRPVGGYDDLVELDREGQLDRLLGKKE
ncbi:MAG: glutaredoxin 3 [Gammaproteobacteria bacterium]|nr:MAG: glutaredoxin 3 [Gammaproteobacteria bacterium]